VSLIIKRFSRQDRVGNGEPFQHCQPTFGDKVPIAFETGDSHPAGDLHDAFRCSIWLSDLEFDHVHGSRLRQIHASVNGYGTAFSTSHYGA
jgi:hypothetical protein